MTIQTQWDESNKGKCGICGDPWDGARENETPGKYATGTIVATYNQGQVIDADVEITSNHKGWIEFRLCENNDVKHDKDQSCFDKYDENKHAPIKPIATQCRFC